MKYVRLGNTGLNVSRLALGCMSYGDRTTAGAHEWALNDEDAQPFFRQAVELGITFWDTANVYQAGTSEELVGRATPRELRLGTSPIRDLSPRNSDWYGTRDSTSRRAA